MLKRIWLPMLGITWAFALFVGALLCVVGTAQGFTATADRLCKIGFITVETCLLSAMFSIVVGGIVIWSAALSEGEDE